MIGDCTYTVGTHLDKDGYPRMKWKGRLWRLNRWIYTLVHGEIPLGMVVGHRCNNKGCINPNHLYLTTPEQNSTDAAKDGLYFSGHHNSKIKFAKEDVEAMWDMYHNQHITQTKLAKLYGIYQSRVSEILREYKEQVYDR